MRKAAFAIALMLIATNLSAGFRTEKAKPTCNIKVVSYKFVGTAGTTIEYGKRSFTLPATGTIELIATKSAASYTVGTQSFQLPVNPQTDEFGAATVQVSSASAL